MLYSSRHACLLFSVAPETVRNWSEEFSRHLSVTANPGKGRHRNFTEDDMRVLGLISDLKNQGLMYEDIHAALDNGQRGEPPNFPPDDLQALVVTDQKQQSIIQLQQLELQIANLKQERDQAIALIQPTRDENIKLATKLEIAQERIDELSEQLEKAQRRIEELNREVGQHLPKE
jgi:DNA-binding transcriptional MerR regulator